MKKKLSSTSTTEYKTDMNIIQIKKYKKLDRTSTTEHKAEHNYTLVNQAINIHKSNKGVTNPKTPNKKGLRKYPINNCQVYIIYTCNRKIRRT